MGSLFLLSFFSLSLCLPLMQRFTGIPERFQNSCISGRQREREKKERRKRERNINAVDVVSSRNDVVLDVVVDGVVSGDGASSTGATAATAAATAAAAGSAPAATACTAASGAAVLAASVVHIRQLVMGSVMRRL